MIQALLFILPHAIVYFLARLYLEHLKKVKARVYVERKAAPQRELLVCTDDRSKDLVVNALDDLHVSPIHLSIVSGINEFKNIRNTCQVWMSGTA